MSKIKLFTEAEAAEQMTISAITLYRKRKAREIRHYRQIGRLIRYTQEDIAQNVEDMKAFKPSPVSRQPVTEARFG
jgi:excisionase family DNA binding protein